MLFGEPEAAGVAARLVGASLTAPALLPFEIGNVCIKKVRRFPEKRVRAMAALGLYARMSVDLVAIDVVAVATVADQSGLTVYDASYLWLARKLSVEMVTLDLRLEAAAKQGGQA
jgi:predicted nucleic acid-binding protein